VKDEKEMGREFAVEIEKQLDLVENPEIVEYVTRIGEPIVQAAQPMSYRFKFHVVNNSSLNAFAVPGGHTYLFSGLLLKAQNVQEVAGVTAHELAHVKLRHSAEMAGKGTLVNLISIAAMIAAAAAGAPAQASTVGAMGAGQALQLSFSREFEREADRYGLFYLYEAGYDPNGLLDFFSTMLREQRFSTDKIPPYLLTHPVSQDRIISAENQIMLNHMEVREPREVPYFYRFQGLLQAEVMRPTDLIPLLKARVEDTPNDPLLWHQLALACDHYGYSEEAISALQRALALDPELCPALVDMGSLETKMGEWTEAESHFDRAMQLCPYYPDAYTGMGKLFLQLGDPRQARIFLDRALSLEPNLIEVHELMAKVSKEMKDDGGYNEEMASYFDKLDRLPKAIQHLEKALEIYGEDSEAGKRVKQRIEEIQSS
jgi:predicted Zn-dependent protease